jgi:predicted CopG family antitoxin
MMTTIRVSEDVAKRLEDLKKRLGMKNLNEVILHLTREYRISALNSIFGVDRGRIKRFSEEDRIEDRG